MGFKHIIHGVSRTEITQNGFYRDPSAADHRATVTDLGIQFNFLIHKVRLISDMSLASGKGGEEECRVIGGGVGGS